MGEIIKGWRRKTGLFLLVLAMPLSMAWVRSFNVHDEIQFSLVARSDRFDSFDGTMCWMRTNRLDGNVSIHRDSFTTYKHNRVDPWSEIDFDRRWNWMGFEFGATTYHEPWSPAYFEFWVIPYWSLALPPTLLSAYLLLTKPRASKPPVSDPDANRVGD